MVSIKNIKYKAQQDAKRVPHYGIRKLSVGVASVLLGTVFYMQNGTVHADVNPVVSAGNNNTRVINENSGTNSSTVFSNTFNRADSANLANSVDSTGGVTNSITSGQALATPVEREPSEVHYTPSVVNEPGSGTSTSQTNTGANVVSGSGPVQSSVPVPNGSTSFSTGNSSNGRSLVNLSVKPSFLAVFKVAATSTSNNVTNGGFDQSKWGTLDVSKWTGQENNGVYELTGYTGDLDHIIVPNSADFAKAGRSVGQVGISADTTHSWFEKGSPKSIAFSKTDGQMIKAVGSNWTGAFTGSFDRSGEHTPLESALTLFDGSNLDILNITNMLDMFAFNQISDLTSLANWKTDNVTDMRGMFGNNQISDLAPLANWKTDNVTDMGTMFMMNQISDLSPLVNWKTNNVTDMSYMFMSNQIIYADFTKWNFGKVNSLDYFIYQWGTPAIIIVKNADQTLLSNSQAISTEQNQLHFGADAVDMPTIYVASDKADARQKILADINTRVSEYQANHTDKMATPTVPLDQLTELVDLANANFVSAPLDVQFKLAYYDLTGKLVDFTTSTHKVGETVAVSPVAPDNYVLVSGQLRTNYLMRWGLNEVDFLVEPKVTQTMETKTVSRTIKVQTPDGQTQNVVQTVKFVRNGYLNQVTKQTTYSPWPFNGQYQFSSYQPKPIDGYSVDVAPEVTVTPDSSDTTVDVVYHKLTVDYSVAYQLSNGTVVKNVSVTPGSNGLIHLTAPQGYQLLTSVSDVRVGPSGQKLAVLVAPAEQTYTAHSTVPSGVTEPLTKTVTRTVKITLPNGHVRTVKQSVKFERTATVKADGTVSYSNWQALGRAQFNKVFLPKRHGYHLVMTDASGKALTNVEKVNNVTADMDDAVVSVTYVKD